jgi:choline transporter-like protein 2/4/5
MTAVQGTSFCKSCGDGFALLTRNALRIGILAFIGEFAVIVGKLFIAAFTTMVAYYLMVETTATSVFRTDQPLIPAVLIFIASWIIGSLFMQVYSQTINTLMICFIIDEEMNNGEAQHATRGLQKHYEQYGGSKTGAASNATRAVTQTSIHAI